jgi:hypothetical protein
LIYMCRAVVEPTAGPILSIGCYPPQHLVGHVPGPRRTVNGQLWYLVCTQLRLHGRDQCLAQPFGMGSAESRQQRVITHATTEPIAEAHARIGKLGQATVLIGLAWKRSACGGAFGVLYGSVSCDDGGSRTGHVTGLSATSLDGRECAPEVFISSHLVSSHLVGDDVY